MNNEIQSGIKSSLQTIHGKLSVDVLAECFAEILIKSGRFSEEQIHILPNDQFRRNYTNDITDVEVDDDLMSQGGIANEEMGFLLKMFTSRSSILDNLPETIYIDPFVEEEGTEYEKKDFRLQERLKRQQILDGATKFFRPLEVAYNHVRIKRERTEVELLEKYDDLLRKFWNTITESDDFWDRYLRTLHLVSYVVGDMDKTKSLIEFVLQKPVELAVHVEEEIELPKELKSSLGGLGLGYNFDVGNVFPCFVRIITVTITDLEPPEFNDFYNDKSSVGKLLQEIAKYYFPLDVDIRFDYRMKPEKEIFSFSDDKESYAVLGFSSKI